MAPPEESIIRPIAHIRSDFSQKFGIPRQSGLIDSLRAQVVFLPEYREPEAFRGLEEYSHLWLIWQFSQARREGWSPTVRPPRLGGNIRKGVFATRSPFRPNSLGLSSVRLLEVLPEVRPYTGRAGTGGWGRRFAGWYPYLRCKAVPSLHRFPPRGLRRLCPPGAGRLPGGGFSP